VHPLGRTQALHPLGFNSHNDGWVEFTSRLAFSSAIKFLILFSLLLDGVADYLQPSTQAALQSKMQEQPSPSDGSGHIYAFEIIGTAINEYTL
jgi:hypothetical protein